MLRPDEGERRYLAEGDGGAGGAVEEHHGVPVADPYRWLEHTGSVRTRRWIEGQRRIAQGFFAGVASRPLLEHRLRELFDYDRYSTPVRKGGLCVFSRHRGLEDQPVVCVTRDMERPARVLLDPNELSPDGTVALGRYDLSPKGRYLAYGLSSGGSDWQEWRVRDVATGQDLPDRLRWVKFSGAAWTHDEQGFFYSRYEEPQPGAELAAANYGHRVCYHRLGTPQSEDELVYHRPERKELGFGARVTEDGRYLAIEVWDGSSPHGFFYRDLATSDAPVVELLASFDQCWSFVGNDGPVFWFVTDHGAPRGRLVAIDIRRPEAESWVEVVPEGRDILDLVKVVGDRFIARYLVDARTELRLFDLDGRPAGELSLPGIGTVVDLSAEREDREAFFTFTSFSTPSTLYRYGLDSGRLSVVRQPRLTFDPDDYVTRQDFAISTDGTRVPVFLAHHRDVVPDGDTPTLLYGYGGFRVSVTPTFSPGHMAFMELGGVYAVANVRGGGEYGDGWHRSATRVHKQRSFDDFLAAASWLIDRGVTSPQRLAITGGSNGGLLVGASLTQRPDLFGAALVRVGVLDMLRFHKFTVGWAWVSDYGSPEDPEEFRALLSYSPYHNIRPGTEYPATLVLTADHDDRVVPIHSFKFAAALQDAQAAEAPVLVRVETRAGHGAGTPMGKRLSQAVDELAFLVESLRVDVPERSAGLLKAAVPSGKPAAEPLVTGPAPWQEP